MKTNHLLRNLFCCAILLSGIACSDDEVTNNAEVDDPEVLPEECPTTDQLEVTHDNTLYYLSVWSEGVHSVTENMVNRYKEVVPYYSVDEMEAGDAFLFSNNDIARIQSDAALFAEMKRMVDEKSVIMMMEGGTYEDFDTICSLLDVFNPYGVDDDNASDESAEALPLWIFSGELPGSKGFFAKLISSDSDYEYEHSDSDGNESEGTGDSEYVDPNEHANGVRCDMASLSLQNALEPRTPQNGSASLTDLVNAYFVTHQKQATLEKRFTSDKKSGTNHFQIEAKIWNVYSYAQDKQFYLVNLGFICSSRHTYFGEWRYDGAKAYGWCLIDVKMNFNPTDNYGATIHDYSPTTTQHQTSYTSDVSFNLGGEVSVEGPSISGGVTISNSHTETINDIEVKDLCEPIAGKPELQWEFVVKEPDAHFNLFYYAMTGIDKGAEAGITTCSLSSDFIFSVSNDVEKARYSMELHPTYKIYEFSVGSLSYWNTKYYHYAKYFNLPKVKPE